MSSKIKTMILMLINAFIFFSTLIVVIMGCSGGASAGQLGYHIKGIGYFKPFTIDSNILMGVFAGIMLVVNIQSLVREKYDIPKWAEMGYFVGANAVLLTFVTVVLFLAPTNGFDIGTYALMFSNDLIFLHLLTPLLACLSFCCLMKSNKFTAKQTLWGVLPTFLYSLVYVSQVVLFKNWEDFYGFIFGGQNQFVILVMLVMYGVTFVLGYLLIKLHNKKI